MKTVLPPTATAAQILRAFCATGRAADPRFAYPFRVPNGAKKGFVTVAYNGQDACLWTLDHVGDFKHWHHLADRAAESPLPAHSAVLVGTHVPLTHAVKHPTGWKVEINGQVLALKPDWVAALQHADACHLGLRAHHSSPFKWISLHAVAGPTTFVGVLAIKP